jgi:two-component system, response regulator PdtaR
MASPARVSVLTAEDNPIIRAELRLVLEQAGYDVCADARDGEEAVRLARQHRPDLILLDLSLPHLDGVEAAKQIRAERNIPFVAVTGFREGDLVDRARAAGASSVVLKPYRDEAILGAVRLAVPRVVDAAPHVTKTDELAAARQTSLETIGEIISLVGYPTLWAGDLEARAFAAGQVWRRVW